MPVNETPAAAGMKFILIDLKINKLESGQELISDQFVLETGSGEQHGVSGGMMLNLNTQMLTLAFEVAEDEDITALQLSYR